MAIGLAVAALVLGACGDDASGGEPCKEGMMAGDTFPCLCDEARGVQVCGEDDKLSACDCTGPDGGVIPTGGTGGIITETGGMGGTGAAGGTGGTGGVGGDPLGDGGLPVVDSGTEFVGPPSDGTPLSTCDVGDAASCGDGLTCYNSGAGPGYCTPECAAPTDCDGMGDNVGCSQGACRYTCTGVEDTSCPMFMECIEAVPGTFRCNYPEDVNTPPPPAGDGTLYSVCTETSDCMEGLRCNAYDHCTHDCMEASECEPATTGDLDPTCSPNTSVMGQEIVGSGCRFTCDVLADPDVCPEGLSCTPSFGGGRCSAASGGGGLPGGGLPGGLPGGG
jgi:hypothetical protein